MKAYFLISVILFCSSASYAQADTIYMNGDKALVRVVEITGDEVKFIYPDEDFINTVYKNTVQKIAFKSGRVQTFTEGTSFKKVSSVEDFNNVTIATVEREIRGLSKIGDVSAKAKGTTTIANQERVKQRAYRKLKIEAAMMGANTIYLTNQRSQGNQLGTEYHAGSQTETSLTGVAYSNSLPDFDEFKKMLGDKNYFITSERYQLKSSGSDYSKKVFMKDLLILNVINDNGATMIEADLGREKNKLFRLASFDNNGFNIFYQTATTVYNVEILF